MRRSLRILALTSPLVLLVPGWGLIRGAAAILAVEPGGLDERGAVAKEDDEANSPRTTAVTPKPLSAHLSKGLTWLVEHQNPDGGWSQGDEAVNMGRDRMSHDSSDVADTCIAALALVRSGSNPREGPYKDAVARAVRFVRGQVDASDTQSLSVSNIQGTRVQMKLGPNIDTFLASLLLAEVKGRMPEGSESKGVDLALDKVLDKIKKNQKADGTWDNQRGWAPILAQSVGGKALNRARQNGAIVSDDTLARAENFAKAQFAQSAASAPVAATSTVTLARVEPELAGGPIGRSVARGRIASAGRTGGYAGMGSAGVELYDRAASVGVLQESVNTNATRERDLRDKAENSRDEDQRVLARKELERIGDARRVNTQAQAALLDRLDDPGFVSGFGSNGGEEFLSYMNISESLVIKGGHEWKRWDDAMASNLARVQNGDGSWTGHHCITGRTFCTSSALLVLLADRTPVVSSGRVDHR